MEKTMIIGEKILDSTTFEHKELYEYGSSATDVGTSDTTVLDVPSGKTFYARNIIVGNTNTGTVVVDIYDGDSSTGTHKAKIVAPAENTVSIENIKGMTFTDSVVAVANTTGATMTITGELTE